MATARKKTAGKKPAKPAKAAKGRSPAPARKAVAKKASLKPAPKPAKPLAKVVAKAAAKPAPKPAPKPFAKPAAKIAPKAEPRVIGKPAVKGTPGKPAVAAKPGAPAKPGTPAKAGAKPEPRVIGKPAVKGPPPKPVPKAPPRLVPATAEAKASHVKAQKPAGTKTKAAHRGEPEVRPLGVLPPESMARPKVHVPAPRPAGSPPARVVPARVVPGQKPVAAKKGDDRLTDADIKHFEQRLLSERAKIMKEMGHLENTLLKVNPRDSAGELSGYSFHMADAGTDSMEREKAFGIASQEGRLLMEIDDALRRLYSGTYGLCEVSGKPISRARLEALPWARLSIEEQAKLEKEQRAGRNAAPGVE